MGTLRGILNELLSILCITILATVILYGIDAEQERRENEAIKQIQIEENRKLYHGFDSRRAWIRDREQSALAQYRAERIREAAYGWLLKKGKK